MKLSQEPFEIEMADGMELLPVSTRKDGQVTLTVFTFRWTDKNAEADDRITVRFCLPAVNTLYFWSPLTGFSRNVRPDWTGDMDSMISRNAPVTALFDGRGDSRFLWQLSECTKQVFFHTGVREEGGVIECRFSVAVGQYTGLREGSVTLRIDENVCPLAEALRSAAAWWENDCGMTPAPVPEAATDPCYSFWYSFHQQVYEADVEEECRRAKALGFDTVIVDDGWQTDDNNRGYAFCGDWEPTPAKICDMAAHVKRVHEAGLKYILWYSVPFVGKKSGHYDHFRGMYLRDNARLDCSVLDPRYREVREFLKGIYVKALKEWDLDGFKLDFIDQWAPSPENAPLAPGMDIPSLGDAAHVFLTEVTSALREIKPDIMLEFRQGYIGPHMREFGNMFRVGDCPDDYIANRVGILDLRMMMGSSAVHSDMLMWHPDEAPENAALQLLSVIYGVIQYSARLSGLTPEMARMSRHLLDFARTHKNALLRGELKVFEPHLLYTWAESADKKENIVTVYSIDRCVTPDIRDTIWLLNGAQSQRILAEFPPIGAESFLARVTVTDCFGDLVSEETREIAGFQAFRVPVGGMVKIEKC